MHKPLQGQTLLVTREMTDYLTTAPLVTAWGGDPVFCPMIFYHAPVESLQALDTSIAELDQYDWIFFTSGTGYRYFNKRMRERGIPVSTLTKMKCGVIGIKTQSILAYDGIAVDFVSTKSDAVSFFNEFKQKNMIAGKSFLLPRSQLAPDTLPRLLKEHGGEVQPVIAYLTEYERRFPRTVVQIFQEKQPLWVMLTSSSIADAFIHNLRSVQVNARLYYASIGPSTSRTLRAHQIEPDVEAGNHHIEGLLQDIAEYVHLSKK